MIKVLVMFYTDIFGAQHLQTGRLDVRVDRCLILQWIHCFGLAVLSADWLQQHCIYWLLIRGQGSLAYTKTILYYVRSVKSTCLLFIRKSKFIEYDNTSSLKFDWTETPTP